MTESQRARPALVASLLLALGAAFPAFVVQVLESYVVEPVAVQRLYLNGVLGDDVAVIGK